MDGVPAKHIAAIALRHVRSAKEEARGGTYSSAAGARIEERLTIAAELLSLISDEITTEAVAGRWEPSAPQSPPPPKPSR